MISIQHDTLTILYHNA